MSNEALIKNLTKVGWKDFSPDEFLGVAFDQVGKAKVARNNWFVLLKSVPTLDAAGLEAWSDHYAHFMKKSQAGMFTSGKYFILILLAGSVTADAAERLGQEPLPGFLELSDEITRGGGYTLLVIKDRKRILMPKKIVLWNALRATEFAQKTHQAVVDYLNSLTSAPVVDSLQLNQAQLVQVVGKLLMDKRFADLGVMARKDKRILKLLVDTVQQANPPSFFLAATALSKAGEPALQPLLEMLDHEQHPVRQMAALALGDIGDPRAVADLVKRLGDPQEAVRQAIAHSLGKIGAKEAVEPLLQSLEDESERVRNAAVKALGLIGDPRALPALMRVMDEDTETTAEWAGKAIAQIQGE
ncbi:MAG: HEAT repeat domain-containing protein [Anaerolineae bacterium]